MRIIIVASMSYLKFGVIAHFICERVLIINSTGWIARAGEMCENFACVCHMSTIRRIGLKAFSAIHMAACDKCAVVLLPRHYRARRLRGPGQDCGSKWHAGRANESAILEEDAGTTQNSMPAANGETINEGNTTQKCENFLLSVADLNGVKIMENSLILFLLRQIFAGQFCPVLQQIFPKTH